MDPSSSLPANLHAERKPMIRLKASASMEAHVSTTLHRTRAVNSVTDSKIRIFDEDLESNASSSARDNPLNCLSPAYMMLDSARLRQRLACLNWFFALYCVFSVLFFSSDVLSSVIGKPDMARGVLSPSQTRPHGSPLQTLPPAHLVSKLSSIYPPPVLIEPFVVQAPFNAHHVTACLWTWDNDIDLLPKWTSRWKGAISLLVATFNAPSSLESRILLRKLEDLQNVSSIKHKISVHVLHLAANTTENPNAFLNLARLFAQSHVLALFPGNLSVVPPKVFYRAAVSMVNSSKPVVFTTRQRTTYPFSSLSPILLTRDSPVWCTERFFPPTSRSIDWSECLWRFWLDSFGDVEVKPTSDWVQELTPAVNVSAAEAKVQRRLSMKYRSETCVLATRQLAALRSTDSNADAAKARWIKSNCREWASDKRELW